jgi:ubiquinone/menaquinone biosynthesis C-methylase UbiE
MALTCPVGFDVATLQNEIQAIYGRVASLPDGEFHFHRGPDYASAMLGYDSNELAQLPADVTASFAGVGNPHAVAPLAPGAVVLDIGCGAGTDLLLAARHVGVQGRAIGVDMTAAMRERAIAGARACGFTNVDVRDGNATLLPVDDAAIDVVISNGVLNLVPDKPTAVREIARVLKRGGRAQIADIVIGDTLSDSALHDIDLWTG